MINNDEETQGGGELSAKHRSFVGFMALNGNQTESARLAGYKSPSLTGYRLMKIPKIIEAVNLAQSKFLNKVETDHVAKARLLRKKDNWQAEVVKLMESAQKEETKARLLEMLGKSEAHLTAQETSSQSINILNISHDDLVKKAQSIMAKIKALPAPEVDSALEWSEVNAEKPRE